GYHQTSATGARGAARAVQVGLVVVGRIEVHHHLDVIDVDAAGGDVGGHEHGQLAPAEVRERALAVALAQVAVDRARSHPFVVQRPRDAVGGTLGVDEHDRALGAAGDRRSHTHLV